MTQAERNPFRVPLTRPWLARLFERALGLSSLARIYDSRPPAASAEQLLDHALHSLNCPVQLLGSSLQEVLPESGATLVVANHPLGGIEGIALSRALLAVRPDTKVLTNELLATIPELTELFLGVDVLGRKRAHKNTAGVRAASDHLAQGGVLLVFPAGQVSAMRWGDFTVNDRAWNNLVGRLAVQYKATCVPVFVHNTNPLYFQLAGLAHKRLRTLLLPRQLANKAGQAVTLTVGAALRARDYAQLTPAAVTHLLRMSTYFLAPGPVKAPVPHRTPLAPPDPSGVSIELLAELAELAPYKLLSKGKFDVYCAPFASMDLVFDALARAREVTFRAVGEGTGNDRDTDRFDPHYQHLFIWDSEQQAIVGGYRLGETDKIVAHFGVNALYSRSLYRYDAAYIQTIGNALEVGRSFVTEAYQRHPAALDLLWRGIGQYIVKNPRYSVLFGCVSISSDHSEMARAFISDAMMESFQAEQKFLADVKPIVPLRVKGKVWSNRMLASIRDISVFNKLVGQCDPGKTIPILLRHYLALNGRFVGFSVNRGFNDALDGLILVDLRKMPTRYLNRYLGKDGLTNFLAYWKQHDSIKQSEY
ncbi:lysophospholipid acyltransferase family protein [Reinekea sp.]|jgi:putative hemolysin|uniref:lysophospholipid acyltransferase family protein n=1 Tax=Reinekea sp. TaxID=1970455 RepID=UPI002A816095|nr:GNAT family N-acyltransferase [Reinekea sp.]